MFAILRRSVEGFHQSSESTWSGIQVMASLRPLVLTVYIDSVMSCLFWTGGYPYYYSMFKRRIFLQHCGRQAIFRTELECQDKHTFYPLKRLIVGK